MNRFVHLPRLRLCAVAALILTFGAATQPARADVLDQSLLKKSRDILKYLRKEGVKNVGVLKFQVQLRNDKPRFAVGRLNSLLETRLENALILAHEDEKNVVGVTRGASQAAATFDKDATYLTPDGLQKLFAHKYPLAWGDAKVQVDAFLTGLVQTSADLKKTTVIVQAYAPGRPKPQEVTRFTVRTDRLLLADMNQGFFLGKRELTATVPYDEGDVAAVVNAESGGDKTADDSFDNLLEFEVFYDGKKAKRNAKDSNVPTPHEGQKVHFTFKARERIGVVLLVNGVNTLGEETEEREPDQYSMWVLEPNRLYTVEGYYILHQSKPGSKLDPPQSFVKPVRVLSESESLLAPLANESKRGKIELIVFREAAAEAFPDARRPLSLRMVTARGKTLKDIRGEVFRVAAASLNRGLMTPDPKVQEGPPIRTVAFNGVVAAHRTITYYQAPK